MLTELWEVVLTMLELHEALVLGATSKKMHRLICALVHVLLPFQFPFLLQFLKMHCPYYCNTHQKGRYALWRQLSRLTMKTVQRLETPKPIYDYEQPNSWKLRNRGLVFKVRIGSTAPTRFPTIEVRLVSTSSHKPPRRTLCLFSSSILWTVPLASTPTPHPVIKSKSPTSH